MASVASTPAAASDAAKRREPMLLNQVILGLAEKRAKAKEAANGAPMDPDVRKAFLKAACNQLLEMTVATQALICEANIYHIESGAGRSAAERRTEFLEATRDNKYHIFNLLKITPEAMEVAYRACVLRTADAFATMFSILDAGMVEDHRSKAEALYDFHYVLSATGRHKEYITFYMENMPSLPDFAYAKGFGVLASMMHPKVVQFSTEPPKAVETPEAQTVATPTDVTDGAGNAGAKAKEEASAAQPVDPENAPAPLKALEAQPDAQPIVSTDAPSQPIASVAAPTDDSDKPNAPTEAVVAAAPEASKIIVKPTSEDFYINDQLFFSLATQIQSLVLNEARDAAQTSPKDGVVYLGEVDDEGKPITQQAVDAAWEDAMLMARETAEYYLIVVFGAQTIDRNEQLKNECTENSQIIFRMLLTHPPSLITPMRGHLLVHATNCLFKGLQECKKSKKPQPSLAAYLLDDSRRMEPTNLPEELTKLAPIAPGRKPLYVGNFYDNVAMLEKHVALLWRSACAETLAYFMRATGVTEEAFESACAAVEARTAVSARPNRRTRRAQKAREDELKKAFDHVRSVREDRARADNEAREAAKTSSARSCD